MSAFFMKLLLIYLFHTHVLLTGAFKLTERALPKLATNVIETLMSTPDPLKSVDTSDPNSHLSKILIPRASGTENNTMVRNHIIDTLKGLNWHIELDEFDWNTPIGPRHFVNVIATKDPEASRRLIVSAHFDSKYFPSYPDNQFLGATDSAAPCAMMLDLAEALNPYLERRAKRLEQQEDEADEDVTDTTLQLVFFDGEEAFVQWTDTDSIYGSRHLAEKWESTYIQPNHKRRLMDVETALSGIECLILLDLLGSPQPFIRSYFIDTAWLFDALASAEKRLGDSGAFTYENNLGMPKDKWRSYFQTRSNNGINYGFIGDDHVPFMHRGVSVLHLIPEPFPSVWHKLSDNADALDLPTMRRWNVLLRVFIAEYLHLGPDIQQSSSARSHFELVERPVN